MKSDRAWQQEAIAAELLAVLDGLIQAPESVNAEANFVELGINSLLAVELVETINERLALNLGIEVIFDYQNVFELAAHISEHKPAEGDARQRNQVRDLGQERQKTGLAAVEDQLRMVLARLLREERSEANPKASFVEMGINSLLAVELVEGLNAEFGLQLGVEVIFDYQEIKDLVPFIHRQLAGEEELSQIQQAASTSEEEGSVEVAPAFPAASGKPDDIAIVGISGRFAGAESVAEFWQHLQAGDDCIREISRDGWRTDDYYDSDPAKRNKSVSRWGGLLADIEAFDPLFFNISPLEAELMDPQQRLFLQEAFKAFEDGGFPAERLSGQKIGVFVGGRASDYKDRTLEAEEIRSQTFLGNDMAILAARVSYFLNLKGPSLSIDTACSSSLVAIHLACESIRKGESKMALAGGVFALSSPEFYIMASKTNMLSPDGKCKTFDNSADGIVAGEGVGAVVLKSLADALAEGDFIYGVIRGSAINQDGRTKGITAPSMLSQKALLEEAYSNADISPETISYIEAHGTGTKLGDPIEIKALTEAFRTFTDRKRYCAIGSHKPNVGHTIMAAGMGGIFKIIMAMKHRQIPPTIHVEQVNEHIRLEDSPFYLNTTLTDWRSDAGVPLRAGVSSFGFSGTNCHMILEEPPLRHRPADQAYTPGYLFPLSAKTEEALSRRLSGLKYWLEHDGGGAVLADIAYTLSAGRSHYPFRCALAACSREELLKALETVISCGTEPQDQGRVTDESALIVRGARILDELVSCNRSPDSFMNNLKELGRLYVQGYDPDWESLYRTAGCRRIPLPPYPFSKERYWFPVHGKAESTVARQLSSSALHPLLQENVSTIKEQRYRSIFTGDEFFLADHVVKGKRIMPGVACLEMVRAAAELSAGDSGTDQKSIVIRQTVWPRAIVSAGAPLQVNIGLSMENTGEILFHVYSQAEEHGADPVVHAQGKVAFTTAPAPASVNLHVLRGECNRDLLDAEQCYALYAAMGIDYGPGHRGVEAIYLGDGHVLAKLALPQALAGTENAYVLHPSMMDAALQASVGLRLNEATMKLALPFALQELVIYSPCSAAMWAAIRYSEGSNAGDKVEKLDIDLFDESGLLCVRMKGFSTRVLEGEVSLQEHSSGSQPLLLHPVWRERRAEAANQTIPYARRMAFFCEPNGVEHETLASLLSDVDCCVLREDVGNVAERYMRYAIDLLEQVKGVMAEKRNGKLLLQLVTVNRGEGRVFAGLAGLLRTVQVEHPNLLCQLIEVDHGESATSIADKLNTDSCHPGDFHICYQSGVRHVAGWEQTAHEVPERMPWRHHGIYLITGGAGGLGRIFAAEIAHQVNSPCLILIGRSPMDAGKQAMLEELRKLGAQAVYRTVDVADCMAVDGLIADIVEEFGGLHGIFHGAGVLHDGLIINKTEQQMREVMAPKVAGLVHLDQASSRLPLDFFYIASSVAGSLGNIGQADYAVANAFMDAYALYRDALAAEDRRNGRTLAVNWPLWKEGGMRVNEAAEDQLLLRWGMVPIQTETGIRTFYRCYGSGKPQIMAMGGDATRIQERLLAPIPVGVMDTGSAVASPDAQIHELVEKELASAVSRQLKIRPEQIREDSEFTKYGFDSITFTEMANKLNKAYKLDLTPTIFFEYTTIRALAEFLVRDYPSAFTALLPGKEDTGRATGTPESYVVQVPVTNQVESCRLPDHSGIDPAIVARKPAQAEGIAIVGISGKFPMADNLEAFWNNLLQSKICVTEVPEDRRKWRIGDSAAKQAGGKRWGGFIDGVDRFDPFFFGISPREAELMDPQQRLLLMEVWHALEDAGMSADALSQRSTGVFVAAGPTEYQNIPYHESLAMTTVVPSMIANRISFAFDLRGPSEIIETACSSTFVALHRAVESIRRGECDQAVVGAVNLLIAPDSFIGFEAMGYLSPAGRSMSFQEGADGYVRSEAVGAMVVKPLSLALSDHDHIYAVVKGTGVAHGGRSMSLTAPSAAGMKSAMLQAYRAAGIDPATVSYIEAHGIGSPLGDGIEISALKSGYQELAGEFGAPAPEGDAERFCYISSLKPNIGHGEVASGISELFKVLMAMQHGVIPGIAQFTELNGNISLKGSRLRIASENRQWLPTSDEAGNRRPRRASISSYGFSGVNAHTVLEEYIPVPAAASPESEPQLVVLSAMTRNQLQASAAKLLEYVEAREPLVLSDLAYTLQVGRKEMDSRLALVVQSRDELLAGLRNYQLLAGAGGEEQDNTVRLYTGELSEGDPELRSLLSGRIGDTILNTLLGDRQYEKLALYWAKGGSLPWNRLHGGRSVYKISLPAYPFEQGRFWIWSDAAERAERTNAFVPVTSPSQAAPEIQGLPDIRGLIGEVLGIPPAELSVRKPLSSAGYSSIQAVTLRFRIAEAYRLEVPLALLNERQTVEQLEESVRHWLVSVDAEKLLPGIDTAHAGAERSESADERALLPVLVPDPEKRYEPFPLTDMQESFLTGRKLKIGGDPAGCHIYLEWEAADLDIYWMGKAWEALVAHHDMLRCVILPEGRQQVLEVVPSYTIKAADLRRKSAPAREEALAKTRNAMSHKVYETGQWPLFDIRISLCPDQRYLVHFSIDEFIIDASGLIMLLQQWKHLYERGAGVLPGLEISFRDYIAAIKAFEGSPRHRQDLDFWENKLHDMPYGPLLPTRSDLELSGMDRYQRTRLTSILPGEQWERLKRKADSGGVSPTIVLLGAFTEILRAWSKQSTFSLILTLMNRVPIHPQLDQVLGPFLSSSLFIIEEDGGEAFIDRLLSHQAQLWAALDHSSVSGVRALRELKVSNRMSGTSSLPVVFTSLINSGTAAGESSFFDQVSYMVTQTPQVYLDHQVLERAGDLVLNWDVAEGMFQEGTMQTMFEEYCALLGKLASAEDVWQESILTEYAAEGKRREHLPLASNTVTGTPAIPDDSPRRVFELPEGLTFESNPQDRYKPFPLTDQQQAYVFGRSAYMAGGNSSCQFYQEIEAEQLDRGKLEEAWNCLVRLHPMLATVIRPDGVQQLLEHPSEYRIEWSDLSDQSEAEAEKALQLTKQIMLDRVFDLNVWPYFELRVSVLPGGRYRIHFSIDMLIADGYSIQLLLAQWLNGYEQSGTEPSPTAGLFRDYVMSLQIYKKTESYAQSMRYWESKFAALPPGPNLSSTAGSTAGGQLDYVQYHGVLSSWHTLKERAGKRGMEPGMVLLTAFAGTLAAQLKHEPFTIAIPCWDRLPLHPHMYETVGDFTAMSWVSFGTDSRSFADNVRRCGETVQADLSHMAVSGLKGLRKAAMRRGGERGPLFPVVFTNLLPQGGLVWPEKFKKLNTITKTPQVYLDHIAEERGGKLYFQWDVLRGVYPEQMIKEMFSRYVSTLKALASSNGYSWHEFGWNELVQEKSMDYVVRGQGHNDERYVIR
ncbi:SDR family NAD(P)-dependent oxidoreductase [Paenibacillus peoriae]|uniref:SDR family NAD(P)-dependent oxidoreductase n=2 Tax=Paenibacillus TaxID=44249 RepID=UPI00215AEADA|nr:SDR family NAD(P)-dependent oxidoreductase [Paenibacillus peoriae]